MSNPQPGSDRLGPCPKNGSGPNALHCAGYQIGNHSGCHYCGEGFALAE